MPQYLIVDSGDTIAIETPGVIPSPTLSVHTADGCGAVVTVGRLPKDARVTRVVRAADLVRYEPTGEISSHD